MTLYSEALAAFMPGNRKHVLVVDDNPTNLKVAVSYLKAYSFEIFTARDGEAGLERARLVRPDLVLLDVEMPGIDGYETCRRLKADPDLAAIPVIFMTVRSETEDKIRGFDAGGVDFVTKPIEARELLARVRTHVELRRLQQRLEAHAEDLETRVVERTADLERQLDEAAAFGREREHLLATMNSHSDQLRRLTRQFLDEGSSTSVGGVGDRTAERLSMAHAHLEIAVERLRQETSLNRASLQHVEQALALLQPSAERLSEELAKQDATATPPEANPLEALSARELEVLRLIVAGRANKEIAADLDVARTTVSTYRTRIFEKLGVDDLPSLVRIAARWDQPQ